MLKIFKKLIAFLLFIAFLEKITFFSYILVKLISTFFAPQLYAHFFFALTCLHKNVDRFSFMLAMIYITGKALAMKKSLCFTSRKSPIIK